MSESKFEILKKKTDTFMSGFVLGAVLTMIVAVVLFHQERTGNKALSAAHIKTVVAADRNCNECHLGASFVNLFKHEAVVSNDNVVNSMMDKAHIKRW